MWEEVDGKDDHFGGASGDCGCNSKQNDINQDEWDDD
jgi:hypothetical protein